MKMNENIRNYIKQNFFCITILVVVCLMLTSCAVMTVDVDVYKGPLANHKEVQTQQVAAMAVGAKPLVERLKKKYDKNDDLYKILNDIEGLYKDTKVLEMEAGGSSNIAILMKEGEVAFEQFQSELKILVPDNEYVELEIVGWNKFEQYKTGESPLNEIVDTSKKLEDSLRDGYSSFLMPNTEQNNKFRKWQQVFRTHKQIWESMKSEKVRKSLVKKYMPNFDDNQIDKIIEKLNPKTLPDGTREDKMRNSANFAFKTLQDTDLLRFHAYLLFSNADTQVKFVQRVKRVASSFTNVRKALHDLSLTALGGLAISDNLKFSSPVSRLQAIYSAAELAGEIIHPIHLILALDVSADKPKIQRLRNEIEKELPIGTLEKYVSEYEIIDKFEPRYENRELTTEEHEAIHGFITTTGYIRTALVKVLEQEPVEMSLALLRAEENFINQEKLEKLSGINVHLKDKYNVQERRVYGLSRVINQDNDVTELVNKLPTLVLHLRTYFPDRGDMSYRGRLPDGIFTLIENYLNAVHKDLSDSVQKERREDLWNALVRFAEKVLFVVNHESLFKELNGTVKDTNQNVKYVRVLQAVGNSILVQIDALRQEEGYKRKLEDRLDGEIAAINRSSPQLPQKVIEDLLASLQADLVKSETELKQVQADYAAANKSFLSAEGKFNNKKISLGTVNNPAGLDIVDVITKSVKPEVNAYELIIVTSDQGADDLLKIRDKVKKIKIDVNSGSARTSHDIVVELLKKLIELYGSIPDGSKQQKIAVNLEAAITYLSDDSRSFDKVTKATAKDAFDTLSTEVKPHYDSAQDRISKAVEFKLAKANIDKERKLKDNAESLFISVQKKKTSLSDAIKATNQVKFDVLAEIDKLPVPPTPGAIYNRLSTALKDIRDEKKKSLKADSGKKSELDPQIVRFNNAYAVVAKETPPMDPLTIDRSILPGSNPDAKDVMDQLIAILRYEYLQEVRQKGVGGGRTANLAQALKAAYIQREGMIYLRPAMSYLRTSFTATSLQRKAPLEWRNMLSEHGKQSLFSWSESNGDAEAVAEIDKQFWQNINRVRVRGVGNTNYVIVKDDVGNWYVKSYSTDVGDIINSAKNLAMFGAGAGIGASFPTSKASPATAGQELPSGTRPQTALERKYTKFSDQYRDGTIKVLFDLRNQAKSIIKERQDGTVWKSPGIEVSELPTGYKKLVTEAFESLEAFDKKSEPKENKISESTLSDLENFSRRIKNKKTNEIARESLSGLQAFRKFHKTLDSKLEIATYNPTTNKVKVRLKTSEHIKSFLDKNINARKTSIKQYESAVVLINEMTMP